MTAYIPGLSEERLQPESAARAVWAYYIRYSHCQVTLASCYTVLFAERSAECEFAESVAVGNEVGLCYSVDKPSYVF